MPINGTVELRSDTYTQPTEQMWRAVAERPHLGDDISREDPTARRLERKAARLLGKEDAILVISGTMANQVAVMTLTERGDEAIMSDASHMYNLEVAGLATLSQVQVRLLSAVNGRYDPQQVESLIRPSGVQSPRTGVICVENTHDLNRGYPVTVQNMRQLGSLARSYGIPLYLDGARIFNASTALEVSPAELAADADMVQVCLTKGLGAPLGSVLAGSESLCARARWMKQRIGGGMRQAGIIAAFGLVALGDERIEALREDHRRAGVLWESLRELPGITVYPEKPLTNIICIQLDPAMNAEEFEESLASQRVRIKPLGDRRFRLVTHHQVTDGDVYRAVEAIRRASNTNRG